MSYTQDQMIAMFNRLQQSLIDRVADTGWLTFPLEPGCTIYTTPKCRIIGKNGSMFGSITLNKDLPATYVKIGKLPCTLLENQYMTPTCNAGVMIVGYINKSGEIFIATNGNTLPPGVLIPFAGSFIVD